MSNNICIECGEKRKLLSFNYAGFDIRGGGFHAFPERIKAITLPGSKAENFLCADCANTREVVCSVHGKIDDYFALGVPPQCVRCKEDEDLNARNNKIQEFWAKQCPVAENDSRLKLLYMRGALASCLIKSDGKSEKCEENVVTAFPDLIIGENGPEFETFSKGYSDAFSEVVSKSQILESCIQFKDAKSNNNTVIMLIKIASADGFLDKSEYDFIRKVAQVLNVVIPEFSDLAHKLGLKMSDNQKDEMIENAKNIGMCALAIGGAALVALLESEMKSGGTSKSSNKKASRSNSEYRVQGRHCGSCIHWAGSRTISSDRRAAIIESLDVEAKCVHKDRCKSYKTPNYSCSKWEKWNCLK